MKLLSKKTVLLFFITSSLFASTPTEEGLFRNGDNADIKGDLITYKIKLHSTKSVIPTEKAIEQPVTATTTAAKTAVINEDTSIDLPIPTTEEKINYIKVIVLRKGEYNFQYLFLFYSSAEFTAKNLIKVLPIVSEKRLLTSEYSDLTQLNIGLLQMLTLNRSTEIVDYIKSIDPTFKRNSEVINKEKAYLYTRYRKYLQELKENPDLKEELEDPRNPKSEEQKEVVKKVEAMPMYVKSEAISLQQNDNKFMWSLNRENIQANFDQKHLFLKSLFINSTKKIRVNIGDFILYDGVHQLPSQYIIDVNDTEKLTVSFLAYREYINSTVQLSERIQYYTKQLEKAEKNSDKEEKPEFTNLLYQLK